MSTPKLGPETDSCHESMPAWVHRHDRKRQRGRVGDESRDKESQALALECLCKMVSLLDGDFARQVVSAGGLQCLVSAMICGDEAQARQAQGALLCIREKLPSMRA